MLHLGSVGWRECQISARKPPSRGFDKGEITYCPYPIPAAHSHPTGRETQGMAELINCLQPKVENKQYRVVNNSGTQRLEQAVEKGPAKFDLRCHAKQEAFRRSFVEAIFS